MSLSSEDFVNAIAKLNDLTRRGLIKWGRAQPVQLAETIGTAYEAAHEGRRLRLVEYSPPRVRGFFQGRSAREFVHGATREHELVLEIVDDEGGPVFEFPKVQGISDLLDTVRSKLTDVEGFIRSLASTD
jgi:hypothetical protein